MARRDRPSATALGLGLALALGLAACGETAARQASEAPTSEVEPVLAPQAFRGHEVPVGFEWVGESEFAGVLPVPGGGYWKPSQEMVDEQPGAPGLSIVFEVLPGSATMTDAALEVLVRERVGTDDRVRIEIDDARGWMEAQPGFTNITLVRPDGVLVLAGGQVSSTQLMTILGELEPIDLPDGYPSAALDR